MRKPYLCLVWMSILLGFSSCTDRHLSEEKGPEINQGIDPGACKALYFARRDSEAIVCFDQALDTLPQDSYQALDYLFHKGLIYLYGSKFEKVLEPLRQFDKRFPVVLRADTDSSHFFENALLMGQRYTIGGYALDNVEEIEASKREFAMADSVFRGLIRNLPLDKPDALAEISIKLSGLFSYQALPDSTLRYQKKALDELEQLKERDWKREYRLASEIGMVYEHLLELDSSKKYLDRQIHLLFEAYEGDTVEDIVRSFTILGQYHYTNHQYDSALLYLNRAKKWVDTHTARDPDYILHFSNLKLGDIFKLAGDYPRAISTYNLAIQHADSNFQRMANGYDKLSPLYLQMKDFQSVIKVSNAALEKRNLSSQFADTQQRIINALLNKSMAFLNLGELDSAQQGISHAEEIFESMQIQYRTTDIYRAKLLQTQGMLSLKSENYQATQKFLQQAITIYTELYGEAHEAIGSSWLGMSRAALRSRNFALAKEYAQNAMDAILLSPEIPNLAGDLPEKSELVLSYSVLANAYDVIAKIYIEQYNQTRELNGLNKALNQYMEADQYLSSNLSQLASESSILVFRNSWFFLYEEAIKVCLLIYQETSDSNALGKAYEFAEKSKAHLLRQSQQDFTARLKAGLDSETWKQEKELKNKVAYTKAALSNADPGNLYELNKAFAKATDDYVTFVDQLKTDNSKYYQLKYELPISSILAIQNSLKAEEAFLQYFEGDAALYQFVILPDTNWIRSIPKTQELVETIDSFQKLIAIDPDDDEQGIGYEAAWKRYRADGYMIYKTLYEPLESHLKGFQDLVVVPDGILMKVPVSALPMRDTYQEASNPPFFLYQIASSYEFSGTTHISSQNQKNVQSLETLGIAPDFSNSGLQVLKRTAEGLERIEGITSGKYLKSKKATKENVSRYLRNYGVLYFATHAEMDTTAPLFSRLAFTPESLPMNPDRDYLYAYEIYNDTLAAQLTILGACETGIGAYERSEGMISLGRAFAYAGCPSLVMSLWKAQYITTSLDILPGFIQHLSEEQPKGRALQLAKKQFLEKAKEKGWEEEIFPYAWATFISVGNQSPLVLAKPHESQIPAFLLPLVLCVLLGLLILRGFNKEKRSFKKYLGN